MANFAYEPLDEAGGQIRLLRLDGMDKEGFLTFSIFASSIKADTYKAVSYVWGTEPASYKVKVNGKTFWLKPNLYSFFKTHYETILHHYLWIDVICIDQGNVEEKNYQVQSMGKIYSKASEVWTWLHGSQPDNFGERNSTCIDEVFSKTSKDLDFDVIAGNLIRLANHSYWSRIWIVQELALAKKAVMFWDNRILTYEDVLRILSLHRKNQVRNTILVIDRSSARKVEDLADRINDLLMAKQQNVQAKASLFDLVLGHLDSSSALAHDHVYALLALSDIGADFPVDYSESLLSLFLRLLDTCEHLPTEDKLLAIAQKFGVGDRRTGYQARGACYVDKRLTNQVPWADNIPWENRICPRCVEPQSAGLYMIVAGLPQAGFCFGVIANDGQYDRLGTDIIFAPGAAAARTILHRDSFLLMKYRLNRFKFSFDEANKQLVFEGTLREHIEFLLVPRQLDSLHMVQKFDRDTNWIDPSCLSLLTKQAFDFTEGNVADAMASGDPVPRLVKRRNRLSGRYDCFIIENQKIQAWGALRRVMNNYNS